MEDSLCYSKPFPRTTICPEGFTEYTYKRCLWIRENQPFPPSCPYPHFYDYGYTKQLIQELFPDKAVWLNVFRNRSSGFPEFEWIENGVYGQKVRDRIVNLKDEYEKDCLVVRNGLFYRVFCSETHFTVCVYSRSLFLNTRASKRCNIEGYQNCILANYDLRNQKCFCQKIANSPTRKGRFCRRLVEPLPFQSELLAFEYDTQTFTHDTCWMGLYRKNSSKDVYRWISTNEIVNYTHWISCDSCIHNEGAYRFGSEYSQNGWILLQDKTLHCALCELSVEYKIPYLELKRAKSEDIIQLVISNPNTISELGLAQINLLDIYCYSDRHTSEFKEYLQIRVTSDFSHETLYITRDIFLTEDLPSHYWCVAFQYPSFKPIVSNTIIATQKTPNYGHEFSIEVNFKVDEEYDPVIDKTYIEVCYYIKDKITNRWNYVLNLRPMRGYLRNENSMDMVIHVTTRNTHESATEQQLKLMEIIEDIQTPEIRLSEALSSDMCLSSMSLTIDGEILEWPETRIGATATPSNILCLDRSNNMLPVTRECTGSFLFGGKWSKPKGDCYAKENHSESTMILFNLTKSNASAENITKTLREIAKHSTDIKVIDIHLIAILLEKLETFKHQSFISRDYVRIVSDIMNFNKIALKDAQLLLNSTDKMLSSLANILNKENVTSIASLRLLAEVIEITDENIIGLAWLRHTSEDGNLQYYVMSLLFQNSSLDNLTSNEDFEIAVILPSLEKEDISNTKTPVKLIVTIFFNDLLFNSLKNNRTNNTIIDVTMPNFNDVLKTPLKIFFKTTSTSAAFKYCCHWNYGIDDLMISKHGFWEENTLSKANATFIEVCEYHHMTHFGLFLRYKSENNSNDDILRIITAVGSVLSLIGIIPIFITAFLFKQWRSRIGNIILLHFCTAVTLQVILTFSSYPVKEDGTACKVVGALLHYTILSEFCWMLVVAILQYKRFVIVFNKPQSGGLLKHLLIGWGMPLIPVIITLSISPENYKMNNRLCYVTEYYFIYGLVLPVILILIHNLVIFVGIFYSISQANIPNVEKSHNYKLEIFLAVLLFFMLGFTWVFGIVGALGGGIWFTYLFCITATIRGFVLFSFFIAGNKETRKMWEKRVKHYIDSNVTRTS
ncbi:hypothetical protein ILUMI_18074 [Ignelater luminosus]|uniref:G-protein coupled receptors family 2 profile 2 domain-containing protein n=1 Tax=Ignelater luminosus TaxID=2038154 RepID=A0A8K0CIQ4_IGNLU|nr:hypothetical protein ILUMI_18074 [Ignelater luminosus]